MKNHQLPAILTCGQIYRNCKIAGKQCKIYEFDTSIKHPLRGSCDPLSIGNATVSEQLQTSRWISLKDSANYLGCTERHMRELARTRRIRSAVVARKLRFDVADLDAFVEGCVREQIPQ
jgi:excisionase family DNA binding protein